MGVSRWAPPSRAMSSSSTLDFSLASIDVSEDGENVVVSDTTGNLRIIDVDTGEERLPRPQGVPGPTDVQFSPDGRHLPAVAPAR